MIVSLFVLVRKLPVKENVPAAGGTFVAQASLNQFVALMEKHTATSVRQFDVEQ